MGTPSATHSQQKRDGEGTAQGSGGCMERRGVPSHSLLPTGAVGKALRCRQLQ